MSEIVEYIRVTPSLCRAAFVSFTNRDGKQWLIPLRNMAIGLEIYEPSGIKGKILKKCLPVVTRFGVNKGFRQFDFCNVELEGELKTLLDSIYQHYEFSIFCGTPSTDQKLTIQIFSSREILGYCKIGTSERVHELFKHERDILEILHDCNINHVPRCKGVFDLDKATRVFIQTTEKKPSAKIEHNFGPKQKAFLDMLFERTRKDIAFEKTDYYSSILFLKQNIKLLKQEYQKVVTQAVDALLSKYKGQHVLWGMCHRDFTPWNTCMVDDQLFVFDFEYALRYAPPEIDRWHFFVQTLYYEKKLDPNEIAHEFLKKHSDKKNDFELYLLDNISMYLMRGNIDDIQIANQKAYILVRINEV